MNVCVLSGGFGGAKFVRALVETLGGPNVSAIVTVGDDLEALGVHVSPDRDSVLYALAGVMDERRGWGRDDETWNALETVSRLGGDDWFKLGDRDLGLHLLRTQALRSGEPLSSFTARVSRSLGVDATLLPATGPSRVASNAATAAPWPPGASQMRASPTCSHAALTSRNIAQASS
jgi:LPPG:FO 2-phospho-L-lactate transferase